MLKHVSCSAKRALEVVVVVVGFFFFFGGGGGGERERVNFLNDFRQVRNTEKQM